MNSNRDYQAPLDLLKDKIILVTGAGQGIGEAVALHYARYGATLILLGRNEKKLAKVYDRIEALGAPRPAAIPLDLSQATEVTLDKTVAVIYREFGRLDGLLHNAHSSRRLSPLINQKLDDWLEMFRINTAIPFALTRACLPLLKASSDASVLLTGETHALSPKAYWGGYSISKAGLSNFLAIATSEWDHLSHLRINMIVPGPVHSPFRTKTHPGEAKQELPPITSLLPIYLYWMGKDSRGRCGETIIC